MLEETDIIDFSAEIIHRYESNIQEVQSRSRGIHLVTEFSFNRLILRAVGYTHNVRSLP